MCTHCSNSLDGFKSIILMRIVCALRLLFRNYFMIVVYVRWHSTSGQKYIHNHQYFSSTHIISYGIFQPFTSIFFVVVVFFLFFVLLAILFVPHRSPFFFFTVLHSAHCLFLVIYLFTELNEMNS